jgi:hypothetical protein
LGTTSEIRKGVHGTARTIYLKVEVGTFRVTTTRGTLDTTRLADRLACLDSITLLDTNHGKVAITGGDTIRSCDFYLVAITTRVRVTCYGNTTRDS